METENIIAHQSLQQSYNNKLAFLQKPCLSVGRVIIISHVEMNVIQLSKYKLYSVCCNVYMDELNRL